MMINPVSTTKIMPVILAPTLVPPVTGEIGGVPIEATLDTTPN